MHHQNYTKTEARLAYPYFKAEVVLRKRKRRLVLSKALNLIGLFIIKKTKHMQNFEVWTLDPQYVRNWEFPDGPVVGTWRFHCSDSAFSPWLGN